MNNINTRGGEGVGVKMSWVKKREFFLILKNCEQRGLKINNSNNQHTWRDDYSGLKSTYHSPN